MPALGVAATLAANSYSGSGHGVAGVALAMWPGVAFVGSAETAPSMVRIEAARKTRMTRPAIADSGATMTAPVRRTRTAHGTRTKPAPVTVESAALRYAPELAAGHIPSRRSALVTG